MKKFESLFLSRIKKLPRMIFRRKLGYDKNLKPKLVNYSQSEQAHIFVVNHGERPALFRCESTSNKLRQKRTAFKIYYANLIAYELFPENTIKPISVEKKQVTIFHGTSVAEKKRKIWGVVSEIVKKRSKSYKHFQQVWYNNAPKIDQHLLDEHKSFAKSVKPIVFQMQSAGIEVNNHPVNIINSNGKPVFVEISEIDVYCLEEYLKTQINPEKRKRIELLIKRYMKYNPEKRKIIELLIKRYMKY